MAEREVTSKPLGEPPDACHHPSVRSRLLDGPVRHGGRSGKRESRSPYLVTGRGGREGCRPAAPGPFVLVVFFSHQEPERLVHLYEIIVIRNFYGSRSQIHSCHILLAHIQVRTRSGPDRWSEFQLLYKACACSVHTTMYR